MRSFKLRASIVARIWISEDGGDDGGGGGTTPAWLPDGAVAFADFVNGNYYANGAEISASQFMSDPSLISVEGLVVPEGIDPPTLLGAAKTAFLASTGTCVLTFAPDPAGSNSIIVARDADDTFELYFCQRDGLVGYYSTEPGSYTYAQVDTGDRIGLQKFAWTYGPERVAVSLKGGTVVAAASSATTIVTTTADVFLGGYSPTGSVTIKDLTIYPPVPDADLPALSALS